MTELKTLKDMELWTSPDETEPEGAINKSELKQEAIKYYNKFQSENAKDVTEAGEFGCICGFIIGFFNITDDDLTKKEEKQ